MSGLCEMDSSRNTTGSWLAILLAVAALVVPFAQPPHASAANGSLVIAALRVLEHNYVDPARPVSLLNAAIATLRTVTRPSAEVLPGIPKGTPEATAAAWFVSEFSNAAHFVPVEMSESRLAYAATEGMLASLKDSHTYYLDPRQLRESQRQLFGNPTFTGKLSMRANIAMVAHAPRAATRAAKAFLDGRPRIPGAILCDSHAEGESSVTAVLCLSAHGGTDRRCTWTAASPRSSPLAFTTSFFVVYWRATSAVMRAAMVSRDHGERR